MKFLGGGFNTGGSDDKPKVKEADTIKLPAIPGPETYRNWRIKTREAIVAASTNPDAAFEWIAEVWKGGQNIVALGKAAGVCNTRWKTLVSPYQHHYRRFRQKG